MKKELSRKWRVIVLGISLIEIFIALIVIGFIVAVLTGHNSLDRYELSGWLTLLSIGLTIILFFVVNKYCGGTFAKRLSKKLIK
jgi:uncharacterized membrane protein